MIQQKSIYEHEDETRSEGYVTHNSAHVTYDEITTNCHGNTALRLESVLLAVLFCTQGERYSPFFRRSILMPCPSSLRHISFGVGKPSALHVRVMFWFSRTATDDCVLLPSRILGGTVTMFDQVKNLSR
jgi:hypothetical protein